MLGLVLSIMLVVCTAEEEPEDRLEVGSFGCAVTSDSSVDYVVPKTVGEARRKGFAATARDAAAAHLADIEGLQLGTSVRQKYVTVVEQFAVVDEDDRTVKVLVIERIMRGVWAVTSVQDCAR